MGNKKKIKSFASGGITYSPIYYASNDVREAVIPVNIGKRNADIINTFKAQKSGTVKSR